MKKAFGVTNIDFFMVINFVLLSLMAAFVYYIGEAEFFIYGVAFIVSAGLLWRWLRRFYLPWSILLLLQIGLMLHFAGGLVHFDGVRLYDHIFFHIRFDKYVHFYNSFAGTIALNQLFNNDHTSKRRLNDYQLVLFVFGAGIAIELVELLAYLTLPLTGVGNIFNNAFDLVANILGGTLGVIVLRFKNINNSRIKFLTDRLAGL